MIPSIFSISILNPKKKRCGDASFSGNINIAGEDYTLLIVADGVSRAPKDWLASRSTVDFIVEELKHSTIQVPKALKAAIELANYKIHIGVDDTYGMLSTLSLVLFSSKKKKIWLSNVGDSRIFGMKNGKYKLLTIDDSTSMPYKENGKLKLQNGMPIMMNALTKAMGQSGIEITVTEILADEFEAVVLASDGFYGLLGFENYVGRLLTEVDMSKTAQEIQSVITTEINDDASFAILRFPATNNLNLKEIILQNDSEKVSAIAVLNVLETEIRNAIVQKDIEYIDKIMDFMEEKNISYNRPKMIELLELMIGNQIPTVHKMTSLIRKL